MERYVEQPMSIRQLANTLGASHTQVRRVMNELNIKGEAQGPGKPTLLNAEEQRAIAQKVRPEALTVPTHTTEVMPPNGYGKDFDLGAPVVINLHVHTGNTGRYQGQSQASDSNAQTMLHQILAADRDQGREDAQEVEAIAQAFKSKRIETRLAGHAAALGKSVEDDSSGSGS